jgi:hypothetical protein
VWRIPSGDTRGDVPAVRTAISTSQERQRIIAVARFCFWFWCILRDNASLKSHAVDLEGDSVAVSAADVLGSMGNGCAPPFE